MKMLLAAALLLVPASALAQSPQKIQVALDVQGVGPAASEAATKLLAGIRQGLQSAADIDIVGRASAHRVIRVIVSAADGVYAASLLVTEQYDRPTLMMLGIEDDDLADRMMLLQIVNEHQGFAGRDLADIGRQVVASLDDGVFKALRSLRKP
jgi:hypothetical protein